MGDVQEAAGKGGKGRTGSSVLQQHKSALLLQPSRTPQLRKEQFLLVAFGPNIFLPCDVKSFAQVSAGGL